MSLDVVQCASLAFRRAVIYDGHNVCYNACSIIFSPFVSLHCSTDPRWAAPHCCRSKSAPAACAAPSPIAEAAPIALNVIVFHGANYSGVVRPTAGAGPASAPNRTAASPTLGDVRHLLDARLHHATRGRYLVWVRPSWRCVKCGPFGQGDEDVPPPVVVVDCGYLKRANRREFDNRSHNNSWRIAVQLNAIGIWMRESFAARIKHAAANHGSS